MFHSDSTSAKESEGEQQTSQDIPGHMRGSVKARTKQGTTSEKPGHKSGLNSKLGEPVGRTSGKTRSPNEEGLRFNKKILNTSWRVRAPHDSFHFSSSDDLAPSPTKASSELTDIPKKPSITADEMHPKSTSKPVVDPPRKVPSSTPRNIPARAANKRRQSNSIFVMSSDDEAEKHDDSEVSVFEPQNKHRSKKRQSNMGPSDDVTEVVQQALSGNLKDVANESGNESMEGEDDDPANKNTTSATRLRDEDNPLAHLKIGKTFKKLSHADQKLLKAVEEGRSAQRLATMYSRISKIRPISEAAIKKHLGRVQASVGKFSTDDDQTINSVKRQIEEAFENVKWRSIAAVWYKKRGRKVGHRVLKARWDMIVAGEAGVNEDEDDDDMEEGEIADETRLSAPSSDEEEEEQPTRKKQKAAQPSENAAAAKVNGTSKVASKPAPSAGASEAAVDEDVDMDDEAELDAMAAASVE